MITFNKAKLLDKIHAGIIGKNLGGTLGGPFEGKRDILQVEGFTTPKGEPLPNDDLDLQLVWLRALEDVGARNITPQVLAEYFLDFVTPHWAEYGVCKANMTQGMLPPLSGAYNNPWKDSNGAWIRTEIWASICPGCPDEVVRFAYADASVDHGIAEGTWAAIFTAALESAAFVESDIRKLLDIGLSKIPEKCRVTRTVKLVIECFDNGDDWITARNKVVADNKDLGWFMAPGNIGFLVLALLYGKGDVKKSLLTAVNCGDDTDCTAGTVGAILGIINGTQGLPADWCEYIGDKIVTCSIGGDMLFRFAKTSTDFANRLLEQAGKATSGRIRIVDNEDDNFEDVNLLKGGRSYAEALGKISPWSYDVYYAGKYRMRVEFDRQPDIKPCESIKVKLSVINNYFVQKSYNIRWILPEGWSVEGSKHLTTHTVTNRVRPDGSVCEMPSTSDIAIGEYVITAGEKVDAVNHLIVEAQCAGYPTVGFAEVIILG